jgi:hypothetical protein
MLPSTHARPQTAYRITCHVCEAEKIKDNTARPRITPKTLNIVWMTPPLH